MFLVCFKVNRMFLFCFMFFEKEKFYDRVYHPENAIFVIVLAYDNHVASGFPKPRRLLTKFSDLTIKVL